ncbi:MAG: hypothetical protein F4X26_10355 [Chloroflexi bacterium]|nr:hypothetical protein [Chloroflexota bacterium]MYD66361.1 hypothetical protein [Chloroflexota bacterium]
MTTEAGVSERVARLEGAYEHLATKSDVALARADIERLRATLLTAVGAAAGVLLTALAIATAIIIRAIG